MPSRLPALLNDVVRRVQHRSSSALGVDESHRKDTVVAMLANNARRVPGYWIQLFLSMGIATLGLVLNSTAVVIGAMLVSPLMGPILELGMGLAVGSALLALRASMRVVLSIALVVASSTVLTLVLPFHEVTSEIGARAAPTALDLLVAVFCALTAAYTTARPGSDTATAAAGTAIGIALVPPLCTVGFGLGVGNVAIAGGAALLFTANLSAIVLLAVFSFLLLGFNQVNASDVECDFVRVPGRVADWAERAHERLGSFFGSRYGLATRVLIPGVFVVSVFVPLRRALDEVTWEVRARDAVRRVVDELSPGAVQTSITVERHMMNVQIVRVANGNSGAAMQERIASRLFDETGVHADVAVIEVADARAVNSLATAERRGQGALASAAPAERTRQRLAEALGELWPRVAGPLLGWTYVLTSADSAALELSHLGRALDAPALAMLETALGGRVGLRMVVRDVAVSDSVLVAPPRREQAWLDSAVVLTRRAASTQGVWACIRGPVGDSSAARASSAGTSRAGRGATPRAIDRSIDSVLRAVGPARDRIDMQRGPRWAVRLSATSCADSPTTRVGSTQ